MLFWKAAFAFLMLPGIVAFAIPLSLASGAFGEGFGALGLIPLGLGLVLLVMCVREFFVAGRGTLAPWSPPRSLVTTGLYRFSRNPMYIAVVLVLFGWALWFRSGRLTVYAAAVAAAFHWRVVFGEEPWLAWTHGPAWTDYRAQVPRWFRVRSSPKPQAPSPPPP